MTCSFWGTPIAGFLEIKDSKFKSRCCHTVLSFLGWGVVFEGLPINSHSSIWVFKEAVSVRFRTVFGRQSAGCTQYSWAPFLLGLMSRQDMLKLVTSKSQSLATVQLCGSI